MISLTSAQEKALKEAANPVNWEVTLFGKMPYTPDDSNLQSANIIFQTDGLNLVFQPDSDGQVDLEPDATNDDTNEFFNWDDFRDTPLFTEMQQFAQKRYDEALETQTK